MSVKLSPANLQRGRFVLLAEKRKALAVLFISICRFAQVAFLAIIAISSSVAAQTCPSLGTCRETAPGGALLHRPNSTGHRVWTVSCSGPDAARDWSNTSPRRLDKICQQISECPAAGAFGKFLNAVTGGCMSKHFDGYFGLDGMTFGILDWTSDNLPTVMSAYQLRDAAKFVEHFGSLNLPIRDGCLDPSWTCRANKNAHLTCDGRFHEAFAESLRIEAFQKAQIDVALAQYERRLRRFEELGLQTEFGNTAMAVVANNLAGRSACKPESWKRACAGQATETKLVDCMLERYAESACRGTVRASRERVSSIKAAFADGEAGTNVHPTAEAVTSCSTLWGGP